MGDETLRNAASAAGKPTRSARAPDALAAEMSSARASGRNRLTVEQTLEVGTGPADQE